MRVSALSLNKKQSSTYNKYACGCFLYAPSICIVYFKRLTEGVYTACGFWKCSTYQSGQGCPWFRAVATFLHSKNSRPEVYTDVHFWTVYFKRLTESSVAHAATVSSPQRFRTDRDVCGFTQRRRFCSAKTRVQKCTRMYTSGQAICKRLTESGDFQKANGKKAFLTGIARLTNDYIYLTFVSVKNLRKRSFNYG